MHPIEQALRDFYAAFARRDGEAMAALYAPDATLTDPVFEGLRDGEPADMWRMLTSRSADLTVELPECTADETTGSARWIARCTFAQTGRPVVNDVRSTFRFHGALRVGGVPHSPVILVTGSVSVAVDFLDEAGRLSLEHVRRSWLEAGCRMHSVHVDVEDAHRLVFHEIWDDAASLRAHFDLPESGRFVTALTALATSSPEMQVYDATPVRV